MFCRGCGRNVENMHIAFYIPELVLHELLDPVAMPLMARAGYDMPTPPPLEDIASVVNEQVHRPDVADPNITGRYPTPDASGGPLVTKQVILDLTEESDGNASGSGTADFTTVRAADKMDFGRSYPNGLTSTVVGPVRLPMVLPSDRLALAAALL